MAGGDEGRDRRRLAATGSRARGVSRDGVPRSGAPRGDRGDAGILRRWNAKAAKRAKLSSYHELEDSASSTSSAFEFSAGYQAGPYTFVEPLGKGGGGQVCRVRDSRLQRDVAIKILPPAPEDGRARRIREARAAAQLNHPGIASI